MTLIKSKVSAMVGTSYAWSMVFLPAATAAVKINPSSSNRCRISRKRFAKFSLSIGNPGESSLPPKEHNVTTHFRFLSKLSYTWIFPIQIESVETVFGDHINDAVDELCSPFLSFNHLGISSGSFVPTTDRKQGLEVGVVRSQ